MKRISTNLTDELLSEEAQLNAFYMTEWLREELAIQPQELRKQVHEKYHLTG